MTLTSDNFQLSCQLEACCPTNPPHASAQVQFITRIRMHLP